MANFIINTAGFKKPDDSTLDQKAVISKACELGFSAIEIRNELLNGTEKELINIASEAKRIGIQVYYSVGAVLFRDNALNSDLKRYLTQMRMLGSNHLKMNLGQFKKNQNHLIDELNSYLDGTFELSIENNQTSIESNLSETIDFFKQIKNSNVYYCFDLANWEWLDSSVDEATKALESMTKYLHLKNVTEVNGKKVVTTLEKGNLDWQKLVKTFKQVDQYGFEYYADENTLKSELELLKNCL